MYVQVVTYSLGDVTEGEYLDIANEVAPRFSGIPGLQAKIWLEDRDLGRYGAVYFWEDKDSMERFLRSDLFEATNPDFVEVDSEGFSILENLTAQTQPGVQVVEARRRAASSPSAPRAVASGGPRTIAAKSAPATPATKRGATRSPAKAAPAKAAPAKKSPAKKAPAKKAPAGKSTTKAATKATKRAAGSKKTG
ncbi:MAG TPA: YdhR family protein [Acidimicrobiales bacterium]|nr:YdhR family protein [Acidimicrobiales bacterium]